MRRQSPASRNDKGAVTFDGDSAQALTHRKAIVNRNSVPMNAAATQYFSYAVMTIVARKVAQMAQTDAAKAADYYDMHAEQLNEVERREFSNAVIDETIKIKLAAV